MYPNPFQLALDMQNLSLLMVGLMQQRSGVVTAKAAAAALQ